MKHLETFSKIVYNENNVLMSLGPVRVTCHEINVTFCKQANKNYKVKKRKRGVQFMIIYLARMTFFECKNAIFK